MVILKPKRIPIKIDMTPMVDIAFLLLVFFMSTTQFRPPEEFPVSLPASHSEIKLPESDIIIITIPKANKVFLTTGAANLDLRYGFIQETETGQVTSKEFSTGELPVTITNYRLHNPKVRIIVKADKEADYGLVEDVMYALQKNRMTRFHLITELEAEPEAVRPAGEI
ncbi:MAG: biopolymer transporter ExbD [Candidatus Latescibacteria bacterium]|nr:biopolymer transporter ExbD [Candidatus Latescibacterota bacterium]NIO55403.1 biopolymer transporter ExbD [Candidatus Latescibacterota bacterium]